MEHVTLNNARANESHESLLSNGRVQPSVVLNNGVKIPMIGFGVFQMNDQKECQQAVETAIEVGYRSIDTAASYMNEEAVGAAVRASGMKREEMFVTTKLWVQDHEYDDTLRAFDTSMAKLGLDYLDLWLIHKPYGNYYAAWRAMERLYKEGRIRAIGVTSFSNDRLLDLALHNEVRPAVNQIETHPFFVQEAANQFMKKENIQHEAWAPFAEGHNDIFRHPVLLEIAQAHGKTVGQVILRWHLQRGVVVIPKTVHRERMVENISVFDFALNTDEMARISALDINRSEAYDDQDPENTRWIGTLKIH